MYAIFLIIDCECGTGGTQEHMEGCCVGNDNVTSAKRDILHTELASLAALVSACKGVFTNSQEVVESNVGEMACSLAKGVGGEHCLAGGPVRNRHGDSQLWFRWWVRPAEALYELADPGPVSAFGAVSVVGRVPALVQFKGRSDGAKRDLN